MTEIIGYRAEVTETNIFFRPIVQSDETKEVRNAFELVNTLSVNNKLWKTIIQIIVSDLHYKLFLTDYFKIEEELSSLKQEIEKIEKNYKSKGE